ncbi:serine hydrolase [Larkinella soli]|uniref:serine hydrolase n=1 Tax=Larkinella soli TaxID=1770527 RepID=UPI000FFC9275|nr:serine hydrolase [Larkinella soli]
MRSVFCKEKITIGWLCLLALVLAAGRVRAQHTDRLLEDLLKKSPELFGRVLADPAKYDVQILYTQINRDDQNHPSFRTFRYRVDKDRYFYPASTVKLPAVLMALEKINRLKKKDDRLQALTRYSPMLTDSAYAGQTAVRTDTSDVDRMPSVAQYAKKILMVSDNDAFNRLYEFIGPCELNDGLYEKGYRDLRIVHRLSIPLTAEQNRRTNPVRFVNRRPDGTQEVLYEQPMQICDRSYRPEQPIRRGTGFMRGDSLIRRPFDFTEKNFLSLEDQQEMLRAVLFPEAVSARKQFDLTPDDYGFLYQYLSQLPRESRHPGYDTSYYDSYCKFLMFGDTKSRMPASIRIFNKVGDAYGYLIDNAYIVDFDRNVEFLLSAVIYCNEDGIFNDDKYDYQTVGFPFLANLGRIIFDYEVKRKRPVTPDLSRFRVRYDP